MVLFTQSKLLTKEQLQIKIVENLEELKPHSENWNQLAFDSTQQLPMTSYAWVSSYFEHYVEVDESWFCVFAYRNSDLVGVLPLIVTSQRLFGFNFSFLVTRRSSQSCSLDIVATLGLENIVIPALIDAAIKFCPHHIGIVFNRLPENSPTIAALEEMSDITLIKELDWMKGAHLKVASCFEEYRKTLSGNLKSTIKRSRKKLYQLEGVKTIFLQGSDATEKHLPQLIEVEAASWKRTKGKLIANSSIDVSFYKNLTRRLSEAGWLEWQLLEAGGKTMAINLAIKLKRSTIIWKLAYDESYSKFSPGTILFEEVVKSAYTDNVEEINLVSDFPWYDNWNMDKRPHYNIKVYSHQPISLIFGLIPAYIINKLKVFKIRLVKLYKFLVLKCNK
ncbi:GNAT family N-acetyltransferase [Nostoc sp. ChiVER01]|uniref:GNAT family N-acetyltransferase n=1 Tax=Nostoc sp. ChiVER01 TaxID=3075382 RepID=UPI002AD2A568|nr:GNAT family N-acetyltransferase [Nostoc sp. ChiVER01]MDZ8221739.1 GNAT family N-acetyltransferase [Nostoc sp. ChiVER01]